MTCISSSRPSVSCKQQDARERERTRDRSDEEEQTGRETQRFLAQLFFLVQLLSFRLNKYNMFGSNAFTCMERPGESVNAQKDGDGVCKQRVLINKFEMQEEAKALKEGGDLQR